jgi:hypothetical protein
MRPAKLKKTLFSQNQLLRYFWPEWLGMRCVRSCVPTVRLWTKGESASQQVSGSRCMHLWFPTLRAERHSPKNGAPDLRGDAYFAKYKSPPFGMLARSRLRIFAAHIGGFLPFAPKNAAREMGHPFPWRYLPPNTCDAYFAKYKRWALSLALVRGACNL